MDFIIGALIITYTILGVPYDNCRIFYPQDPSLIIKAPILAYLVASTVCEPATTSTCSDGHCQHVSLGWLNSCGNAVQRSLLIPSSVLLLASKTSLRKLFSSHPFMLDVPVSGPAARSCLLL